MENISPKPKWYYRVAPVMVALIMLGPLAYPLLWKSPEFNLTWKILLTIIFTALTLGMLFGSWELIAWVMRAYQQMLNPS